MSHQLKPRTLVTSVAAAAIAAVAPAASLAASRPVHLPKPRSTIIVPNVSAGGLRLGEKMFPLPRGWRHPNKCESTHGFQLCAWTSHPEPQMGPAHPATGPLVLVGAYHDRIVRIELAYYGKHPARSGLVRWRTSRGIAIGSPFSSVAKAYGPGAGSTGPSVFTLPGPGSRTSTSFGSTNGVVSAIELNACSSVNPC